MGSLSAQCLEGWAQTCHGIPWSDTWTNELCFSGCMGESYIEERLCQGVISLKAMCSLMDPNQGSYCCVRDIGTAHGG